MTDAMGGKPTVISQQCNRSKSYKQSFVALAAIDGCEH